MTTKISQEECQARCFVKALCVGRIFHAGMLENVFRVHRSVRRMLDRKLRRRNLVITAADTVTNIVNYEKLPGERLLVCKKRGENDG